ncbi:hypothetical protein [Nitratireductor luteus]|nr:hypothetical protein [Nitratireductor luteus]
MFTAAVVISVLELLELRLDLGDQCLENCIPACAKFMNEGTP